MRLLVHNKQNHPNCLYTSKFVLQVSISKFRKKKQKKKKKKKKTECYFLLIIQLWYIQPNCLDIVIAEAKCTEKRFLYRRELSLLVKKLSNIKCAKQRRFFEPNVTSRAEDDEITSSCKMLPFESRNVISTVHGIFLISFIYLTFYPKCTRIYWLTLVFQNVSCWLLSRILCINSLLAYLGCWSNCFTCVGIDARVQSFG